MRGANNGEKAQALSYIERHLDDTYMCKSWRNMPGGELIEERYEFIIRRKKEGGEKSSEV